MSHHGAAQKSRRKTQDWMSQNDSTPEDSDISEKNSKPVSEAAEVGTFDGSSQELAGNELKTVAEDEEKDEEKGGGGCCTIL